MLIERGNGANLIVLDKQGRILVARQNYGEKKLMLPGGKIERGESPTHAAQEETEEETGIITFEENFRLIAYFVQRPNGIVFLYETDKSTGEARTEITNEILEVKFMSPEEIFKNIDSFGLGYARMILQYLRCKRGIDIIPFLGRLSTPVEFINLGQYRDIVTRI